MNTLRKAFWLVKSFFGDTPQKANLRFHQRNSVSLIQAYLKSNEVKKLQIGAEAQIMGGWLNVDILPKSREVAWMDATQPFPFHEETFDFVFSEHMIEHVTFQQGAFMLQECYRVMKPKGKIRISTPNLQFLIDLYLQPSDPLHLKYLAFSQRYLPQNIPSLPSVVVNNFFRDWGHQFIYDEDSLREILTKAGFRNIQRMPINESKFPELHQIERHGNEITSEFNILESLVIEGEK